MNDALKARLVGAAVLLIGLGLLWPLLFDFDESMQPSEPQLTLPDTARIVEEAHQQIAEHSNASDSAKKSLEVPLASKGFASSTSQSSANAAKLSSINTSSRDALSAEPESLSQQTEPLETEIANETTAPAKNNSNEPKASQSLLDERGIPIAYVVQLGTFGSWENANKLRDKLNKASYKTYIRPETSKQAGPYRVQVGPYMAYSQAKQIDDELRSKFKLEDTFIRRFATRL